MRHSLLALTLSLAFIGLPLTTAQAFGKKTSPESSLDMDALTVTEVQVGRGPIMTGHLNEIVIKLDLMPGFHAYVDQYKFTLESPAENFRLREWQIQPQVQFKDPISKKTKWGTQGRATLNSWLEISNNIKPGPYTLQFKLMYQACAKDFCLFPKTITINKDIMMAGASDEKVTSGDPLTDAFSKGWLYTLLIVFFAGVLTSLTPCIFPMIPITLAILGSTDHTRSRGSRFIVSLFYVLGIAFTYSALGLFVARTGALFGGFLGQPLVVGFIALVFVLMALSMYGVFEIQIPHSIAKKLALGDSQNKNLFHAFVSGLVAGVVASPCVGPVLISILAYVAQQQNALTGFILLFTFALGLGQIFLLIGTFNGVLQKLPRSGPWMEKIKYFFGTLMLVMALYYLYPVRHSLFPWFFDRPAVSQKIVDWVPYSETRLNQAIKEKQPVILDFQAEWCGACIELEHKTFSEARVKELGKKFLWMAFDATSPSPELEVLQKKYGIGGLPFVLFYNTKGEFVEDLTVKGFEEADPFLKRMQQALAP